MKMIGFSIFPLFQSCRYSLHFELNREFMLIDNCKELLIMNSCLCSNYQLAASIKKTITN